MGIYVLIFLVVLGMAWAYQGVPQEQEIKEIDYSQVVTEFKNENVKEVVIVDRTINATLKNGDKIVSYAPSLVDISILDELYIYPQMEQGIIYDGEEPVVTPWYVSMLPTLIMIGALIFFWYVMMSQNGGGGKVMNFGKSRARMHKDDDLKKTTYKDVAGLEEEKEELAEVVDFLRNPKKYKDLGARIPKGILLVGPPGTGKTYLSKATAGEAGVPFFSISGSDFVEMFVGVGASRVRDLFEQAKKNAPCIIFIDEIDAVGRKRGAGIGGGHDEREQTLNQLLVEMDGFGENTGIIILAATNRPDILDPALLRPGRFDRQVVIGVPDVKGREAIFQVHSKNKPLAEEVNPKVLARRTPGFTPADIENLLNEAALLAARRDGRKIRMAEIEEAITKVIAGPEKKSRVINEDERKLTAYHEAGHAIVARSLPKTDPVHQITIIPRGRAGGFTMILPKEDRSYGTKATMREQIIHLLGGRVAEKLTLDDISTGASNDIMRATEIAREMVTKYGFSEKLGPVNYSATDEVFLGNDYHTKKNYSEEIAKEIDDEIRAMIDDAFVEAEKILNEHIDVLHTVAAALLEVETLDGDQFELLYTGQMTAEELAEDIREKEEIKKQEDAEEAAETKRLIEEEASKEKALLEAFDTDYLNDETGKTVDITIDADDEETELADSEEYNDNEETADEQDSEEYEFAEVEVEESEDTETEDGEDEEK